MRLDESKRRETSAITHTININIMTIELSAEEYKELIALRFATENLVEDLDRGDSVELSYKRVKEKLSIIEDREKK